MRHLDLITLRTFITVVDEGSFRHASEKLNLAPPTVSLQMKRLADTISSPLFERDGRGRILTDTGRRLLIQSRKILNINDLILTECRAAEFSGHIRIGTTQDFAKEKLLNLLKSFGEINPNVKLELFVDLNRKIHAAFKRNEIDVAIAAVDPVGECGGKVLYHEPLIWIAKRDFLHNQKNILPLVLFHEPCLVRELALQVLDNKNVKFRLTCTSPSLSGLLMATKAGFGVTVRTRNQLDTELCEVDPNLDLPKLPDLSIALYRNEEETANTALINRICDIITEDLFPVQFDPKIT